MNASSSPYAREGPLQTLMQQIYHTQHADEHAILSSDDFRIFGYKVIPCSKTAGHDWTACPFAHANEKAARRCPVANAYCAIACPDMKRAGECPRGQSCMFAHNVFEYWLHPSRYRTQLCSYGLNCRRSVCFFAHHPGELRVVDKSPHLVALESQYGGIDSAFGISGDRVSPPGAVMTAARPMVLQRPASVPFVPQMPDLGLPPQMNLFGALGGSAVLQPHSVKPPGATGLLASLQPAQPNAGMSIQAQQLALLQQQQQQAVASAFLRQEQRQSPSNIQAALQQLFSQSSHPMPVGLLGSPSPRPALMTPQTPTQQQQQLPYARPPLQQHQGMLSLPPQYLQAGPGAPGRGSHMPTAVRSGPMALGPRPGLLPLLPNEATPGQLSVQQPLLLQAQQQQQVQQDLARLQGERHRQQQRDFQAAMNGVVSFNGATMAPVNPSGAPLPHQQQQQQQQQAFESAMPEGMPSGEGGTSPSQMQALLATESGDDQDQVAAQQALIGMVFPQLMQQLQALQQQQPGSKDGPDSFSPPGRPATKRNLQDCDGSPLPPPTPCYGTQPLQKTWYPHLSDMSSNGSERSSSPTFHALEEARDVSGPMMLDFSALDVGAEGGATLMGALEMEGLFRSLHLDRMVQMPPGKSLSPTNSMMGDSERSSFTYAGDRSSFTSAGDRSSFTSAGTYTSGGMRT